MPAVKTHTEELREALIDEAGRILQKEGAAAITLRRLAAATGTSTMAVYTLFGDKAGLLEQMYIEGFERLAAAVAAVPRSRNPVTDLVALANGYRREALRSRHLYELMFGRPVPGFSPSPAASRFAVRTFEPVVAAVARCIASGAFRSDVNADDAAFHMWALAHGLVLLEMHHGLALKRSQFERRYASALAACLRAYRADVYARSR